MITTSENYRIAFIAGTQLKDMEHHLEQLRPNMLIAQFGVLAAEEERELFRRSGAQLIVPSHFEGLLYNKVDVRGNIARMNEQIKAEGYNGRILYPERYQWYHISTEVIAEEAETR